ncbi:hypothetical protein V1511DRAFT_506359 [Dipodascopsis uninucleata]
MEKFSQWRDKGTGIAPFLPHPSSTFAHTSVRLGPSNQLPLRIGNIMLCALSVAIKMPLILVFGILHFCIINAIAPSEIKKASAKVLLYSAGVWFWNVSQDGINKGNMNRNKSKMPRAGDIFISNFVSPLDALVYASLYDAVFVIPSMNGTMEVYGLWGTFIAAMRLPQTSTNSRVPANFGKICAQAKQDNKIIVIFIESTTTNGRGILPPAIKSFSESADVLSKCSNRIFPTYLRYLPADITTPLPPQSLVHYIVSVISRWRGWSIRVRIAATGLSSTDVNVVDKAVDEICKIGRIKRVGEEVGAKSKLDFIKAWRKGR